MEILFLGANGSACHYFAEKSNRKKITDWDQVPQEKGNVLSGWKGKQPQ
jgi:hypothetical protein